MGSHSAARFPERATKPLAARFGKGICNRSTWTRRVEQICSRRPWVFNRDTVRIGHAFHFDRTNPLRGDGVSSDSGSLGSPIGDSGTRRGTLRQCIGDEPRRRTRKFSGRCASVYLRDDFEQERIASVVHRRESPCIRLSSRSMWDASPCEIKNRLKKIIVDHSRRTEHRDCRRRSICKFSDRKNDLRLLYANPRINFNRTRNHVYSRIRRGTHARIEKRCEGPICRRAFDIGQRFARAAGITPRFPARAAESIGSCRIARRCGGRWVGVNQSYEKEKPRTAQATSTFRMIFSPEKHGTRPAHGKKRAGELAFRGQ